LGLCRSREHDRILKQDLIYPEEILFLNKMYVIKVKGIAKIPDYVQLRDDKFTLLAYFRVDRPEKSLEKLGLTSQLTYIMEMIKDLPFGKIAKLDI